MAFSFRKLNIIALPSLYQIVSTGSVIRTCPTNLSSFKQFVNEKQKTRLATTIDLPVLVHERFKIAFGLGQGTFAIS